MIKETQSLIESSYNEKELQRIILDNIDCDYYYLNEWPSCKDWLYYAIHFTEFIVVNNLHLVIYKS